MLCVVASDAVASTINNLAANFNTSPHFPHQQKPVLPSVRSYSLYLPLHIMEPYYPGLYMFQEFSRSDEPYPTEELDEAAVISALTHRRLEFDYSFLWPSDPVPFGIPQTDLGYLDWLPTEIICEVIRNLDLVTLLGFQRTNRRAREFVATLPEYALVIKFASNVLCAVLSMNYGRFFTISDVYTALRTRHCSGGCDSFAPYVFLATLSRCCQLCRIRVWQMAYAYGDMTPTTYPIRTTPTAGARFNLLQAGATLSYRARVKIGTSMPFVETRLGRTREQHGVFCTGCAARPKSVWFPSRWMSAHRMEEIYAEDEYLEHFRWCRKAQQLWGELKWAELNGIPAKSMGLGIGDVLRSHSWPPGVTDLLGPIQSIVWHLPPKGPQDRGTTIHEPWDLLSHRGREVR